MDNNEVAANYHWACRVISNLITAIALHPGTKRDSRLMEAVSDADEFRQEFAEADHA